MDVLGVSCYFHDAAAALLRDGQLVAAAEEERFSRKKHDYGFPSSAIDFCLRTGGIPASAPRLRRVLREAVPQVRAPPAHVHADVPALAAPVPGGDDPLARRQAVDPAPPPEAARAVRPRRILFSEHHLSHAASAFFCSPFDEAAILTVDGVGEWTTATVGRRARHRDHRPRGDPLPALARAALLRLHRVPRLRGQRGRVQGDGHGALRRAAVRRPRVAAHPGGGRRQLRARHELLRVPPLDGADVQRPVRGAVRRAAGPRRALLHGRERLPVVLRAASRGPRGAGGAEPVLRRPRRQHPGGDRGDRPADGAVRPPPDGPAAPLHGRRRGAQQRGQRAHPPRGAVRGALRPAGGGRLGRRAGRGALGVPRGPRPAARVRDGARRTGARSTGGRRCEASLDGRRASPTRAFDDEDRLLDHVVDAARAGQGRRLVPGPLRVGAAGARATAASSPTRAAPR